MRANWRPYLPLSDERKITLQVLRGQNQLSMDVP